MKIRKLFVKNFFKKLTLAVIASGLLSLLFLQHCNLIYSSTPSVKGKFEVAKIEEIQIPTNNLLKNGYFIEWLSGCRVPSGFLPPFSKYSYVLKKPRGTSGYDVVQRWNQAGDNQDVNTCFRIILYDLLPNKKYNLSILATLVKGPRVEVGLWSSDKSGIKPYKTPLLTIAGEENEKLRWETDFTVENADSNYILAAYAPENTPQVIWHHWVLTEK